jgi:hypothetical protein
MQNKYKTGIVEYGKTFTVEGSELASALIFAAQAADIRSRFTAGYSSWIHISKTIGSSDLYAECSDGKRLHRVKLPEMSHIDPGVYKIVMLTKRKIVFSLITNEIQRWPNTDNVIIKEKTLVESDFQPHSSVHYIKLHRKLPENIGVRKSYIDALGKNTNWNVFVDSKKPQAVQFESSDKIAVIMRMNMEESVVL